jgi:hypothetical protein
MDINTQIHNDVCPKQNFALLLEQKSTTFVGFSHLYSLCIEDSKRSKFWLLFDKFEKRFSFDVPKVSATRYIPLFLLSVQRYFIVFLFRLPYNTENAEYHLD